MKKSILSIFIISSLYAESPLEIPKATSDSKQIESNANISVPKNEIPKDFTNTPAGFIESKPKDSKDSKKGSGNAQKENLDYLLEDSNSKFPVSDYVWQKDKSYQDINSLFNKKVDISNMKVIGYDSNGNPIYQDSQGNLYDNKGNKINKTLKQLMEEEKARLEAEKKKLNGVDMRDAIIVTFDKNGKPIYKHKNGNIYDSNGNQLNVNGKSADEVINEIIQESQKAGGVKQKELANNSKNAKKSNTKNKNTSKTASNKANNSNNANTSNNLKTADIDKVMELQQKKHNPLLDEYGISQEEYDEMLKGGSNGVNSKVYANFYRDTLLGQRNGIQTKENDFRVYGDSRFTNQENIDEATNEHKLYRTILAGKLIPAILLTPISSEVEGLVQAQVEQDIYANMGRAVLIPRGSKVLGFYKNDNEIGQARLQIVWREIITPQGVNMILTNAVASDAEGYAGASGHLNNKYWQRYGMGITMQTLANAITFGISNATQNPNAGITSQYMTGNLLAQSQQDINSVLKQIISKQSQIKPIITIKAGSRIYITPTAHIWFPIPKNNETMARYFEEDGDSDDF